MKDAIEKKFLFKTLVRRVAVLFLLMGLIFAYLHAATPVRAQLSPTPTIPWTSDQWVPDTEVTVTGKRGERARQFINWVLDHPSIDNHPVFRQIWFISAGTALFLIVIVVAFMGVGVLVARKKDVSFKVDVVPILYKTIIWLLYIVFSYLIILALIQITDIIMQFFIKILHGDQLFKIFFVTGNNDPAQALEQSERGYITFQGYRRIGMEFEESARSSLFLINFTSFTYFVMGIMLILRKVVLWFLLVVAPFLAILMPFVFIRNIGWIWIGVFFQWAFYGPLFALFLGAMSKIWATGIPFGFDFTRAKQSCEPAYMSAVGPGCNEVQRVVYPLAINILYGGPSQRANGLGSALSEKTPINSSNYIDTFAEYVIALIMLWTVIILPWWLLRIFRDYCCDGIYAMRNILMNMLNGGGIAPKPQPGPSLTREEHLSRPSVISMADKEKIKDSIVAKVPESTNIKNVATAQLAQKLEVHIESLKDIASFETSKEKNQYYHELSGYMSNPMSAQSVADRAAFSRLKTEISQRATQGDQLAQRIIAATTTTSVSMREHIRTLAQQRPATSSVTQAIAKATTMKSDQVTTVLESWVNELKTHSEYLEHIAHNTQSTSSTVQQVLSAIPQVAQKANVREYVEKVSEKSATSQSVTSKIMQSASSIIDKAVLDKVSQMASTTTEQVSKILEKIRQTDTTSSSSVEHALSQSTKESQQVIRSALNVLSSFSTDKSFVQKVSSASSATHEVIERVLKTVPTIAQSSVENAVGQLAQSAKTSTDSVHTILDSISSVVQSSQKTAEQISTVAKSVGTDTQTIDRFITSVSSFMNTIQTQTQPLSEFLTHERMQENQQQALFKALSAISDPQVEHIAHDKNIAVEKVRSIVQSIGQHVTQPAQDMLAQVAQEQSVSTASVQSATSSLFSHLHSSLEQTKKLSASKDIASQISAEKLSAVTAALTTMQKVASVGQSVVQQSDAKQNSAIISEAMQLVSSSKDIIEKVAHDADVSQERVVQMVAQLPQIVAQNEPENYVTQLAQQTGTRTDVVERVLTSVAREVETSERAHTSTVEKLATQSNVSHDQASSFTNSLSVLSASSIASTPVAATIAQHTAVAQEAIVPLVKAISQTALSQEKFVQQVASDTATSSEVVSTLLKEMTTLSAHDNTSLIMARMSEKTHMSADTIQTVLKNIYTSIATQSKTDSALINAVATQTHTNASMVQTVIDTLPRVLFTTDSSSTNKLLSQQSSVTAQQLQTMLQTLTTVVNSDTALIEKIAQMNGIQPEKVSALVQSIPTHVEQTPTQMVAHMAQETSLNSSVVSKVLQDIVREVNTVGGKQSIVEKLATSEHIETEKLRDIILTVLDKNRRQKGSMRIPAQMPMGNLIDIDELISEEDSLSVDEYEEIKHMWIDHYLHGEVPISETIKSREDWVRKDIVDIENVLNKIVSEDEDVRAEGLQQVAEIIPFFMLANMSVTDVAVYLKAKRAAAKEVSEMLQRESSVKARLQAHVQDEFIDIDRFKQQENMQTQSMSMEMPDVEEHTQKTEETKSK